MPHYIQLVKWTEQGIRNVKDSPKRADDFAKMVQQVGGKTQVFYTLGEYDIVAVTEVPSDEAILQVNLAVSKLGNVRTTTLKAWTSEEISKVISKLS